MAIYTGIWVGLKSKVVHMYWGIALGASLDVNAHMYSVRLALKPVVCQP